MGAFGLAIILQLAVDHSVNISRQRRIRKISAIQTASELVSGAVLPDLDVRKDDGGAL
jgi:hypothetical protein